jgi:hypothetical protein
MLSAAFLDSRYIAESLIEFRAVTQSWHGGSDLRFYVYQFPERPKASGRCRARCREPLWKTRKFSPASFVLG